MSSNIMYQVIIYYHIHIYRHAPALVSQTFSITIAVKKNKAEPTLLLRSLSPLMTIDCTLGSVLFCVTFPFVDETLFR